MVYMRVYSARRSDVGRSGSTVAFTDALYVARFRLYLALRLPAAGAEQDLHALLDDLHMLRPRAPAESARVMESITYCAFLHAIIAWLASQLTTTEGQNSLHNVLLHSDFAQQLQQRLGAIFAEQTHQQLLIAHMQRQPAALQPDFVTSLLAKRVCKEGLGAWTSEWATAFR